MNDTMSAIETATIKTCITPSSSGHCSCKKIAKREISRNTLVRGRNQLPIRSGQTLFSTWFLCKWREEMKRIGWITPVALAGMLVTTSPAHADQDRWYLTGNVGVGNLASTTLTYSDGTTSES